jgi:hypothetical protein
LRAEAAADAKGKRSPDKRFHHCALPGAAASKRASCDDCRGRIANPLHHSTLAGMQVHRLDLPALRALPTTNHQEPEISSACWMPRLT